MTTVKIIKSKTNNFCQYAGQCNEQPAYIYLDCCTGHLYSDYSRSIGYGMPMDVWHNKTVRFPIDTYLKVDAINNLMESIAGDCQKILDGFEEIWDGSNYVGSFSEEAGDLIEYLQQNINRDVDYGDLFNVYTWGQWYELSDPWDDIKNAASLEDAENAARTDLDDDDEITDEYIDYLAELIAYFDDDEDLELARSLPKYVWQNADLKKALENSYLDDDDIAGILK